MVLVAGAPAALRPASGRNLLDTVTLFLAPSIPALPGLFGILGHHRTILDTVAGFLAANHVPTGLLVLPVETARDAGLALLAGRVLLAGAAGLALADLARALALPRAAALAAGILYELAAPAIGVAGWSACLALFICPAFLGALERNLAFRSASLRLAAAISIVATVCTGAVAGAVLLFGALWLILRLRRPGPVRRSRVLGRIAVAGLLALLLTFPLLLLDLPFRLAGAVDPFGGLSAHLPDFGALEGFGPRINAAPVVLLAPVIGLACLAAAPIAARVPHRSRDLRLLLLVAAVLALVTLLAGAGQAGPPFLACLALLCGVALSDLVRLRPAPARQRLLIGFVLLLAATAAAAVAARPVSPILAAAAAAATLVTLACATAPKWPAAALAPIVAAAAVAIAAAP